jgi:PAS domain S-box-containing protein
MRTAEPDTLRLAAIVTASDDAIISHSTDGLIETWNPAAETIFGYTADQVIGRCIDVIVPRDRRDDDQRLIAEVKRGGTVRHFETIAQHRDGSTIDVSLALAPLAGHDGVVFGVARIARDISREKEAERELARLAAIVDSADDAIISKDLDGTVRTWNSAAEQLLGYRADEIVGRSVLTIIPENRRSEEDDVLRRIREGRRVEHFETLRRRKDGSVIDVSLTISPIRTSDGKIVGASTIAREIATRRRLERDAWRLAAIVDSSDDAIASKDLNGIVQTWNSAAERMFGYTAAEIVGHHVSLIIPPERLSEETEVLSRIRAGDSVRHFETVRRRKDGSRIEISLTVSPIRAPDGRIIGASKIARDISVQRRLARAAEEANRVKDEFLAMLSHELRTPLNAVLGYTRMLREGQIASDRHDRAFDTIERNAKVLSQLVSDVLDVSSIVTGKIQLRPAPASLVQIIDAAVDVVRPTADAKGVTLTVHKPFGSLQGVFDGNRLQQVFWNLIVNAVKFTAAGGRVDVMVEEHQAGEARVTVSDTGIGIPAEALPFIFQRFWQGERAGRQNAGLGLGLALARHFTELHGGTITATSEGAGRGATFTVALPLRAR